MVETIFIFPRLLTANAVLKFCIMSMGQGRMPLRVIGWNPLSINGLPVVVVQFPSYYLGV